MKEDLATRIQKCLEEWKKEAEAAGMTIVPEDVKNDVKMAVSNFLGEEDENEEGNEASQSEGG